MISFYVTGLPITEKVDKLKKYLQSISIKMFGGTFNKINIFTNEGVNIQDWGRHRQYAEVILNKPITTGEAYVEFQEDTDGIVETFLSKCSKSGKTNGKYLYKLDKSHKLYYSKCIKRPSDGKTRVYCKSTKRWMIQLSESELEEKRKKAQEYDEYISKYCNSEGEIPDDSWKYITVTETMTEKYWSELKKINKNELPSFVKKDGNSYEKLNFENHGFVCDSPECQAMFNYYDNIDYGATGAFVYTSITIYTNRKLKIDSKLKKDLCCVCVNN
tara:strand:+ start:52 stop:870 length:819 start_codon:yes stop_codon:yes gene_type:complete